MKKTILLIGLISLLILPVFSQSESFLNRTLDEWSFSKQIDSSLLKRFNYSMLSDSMLTFPKDQHHFQKWEFHEKGIIDDNMTILIPRGNYPSLIIKPDTTIRYTLLIIKP
jgi:hypothetical protein